MTGETTAHDELVCYRTLLYSSAGFAGNQPKKIVILPALPLWWRVALSNVASIAHSFESWDDELSGSVLSSLLHRGEAEILHFNIIVPGLGSRFVYKTRSITLLCALCFVVYMCW